MRPRGWGWQRSWHWKNMTTVQYQKKRGSDNKGRWNIWKTNEPDCKLNLIIYSRKERLRSWKPKLIRRNGKMRKTSVDSKDKKKKETKAGKDKNGNTTTQVEYSQLTSNSQSVRLSTLFTWVKEVRESKNLKYILNILSFPPSTLKNWKNSSPAVPATTS